MPWPKKIHTWNLIAKNNSCGSKIPLPPHNFSNGPSLKFSEGDALRCRKILVACQNFEH